MMMQIIEAGGVPLLYDTVLQNLPNPDGYDANPDGYFEWRKVRNITEDPQWPSIVEGKAVKLFLVRAKMLTTDLDCRIIVMVRDPREIAVSLNRFRNLPIDHNLEEEILLMTERLAKIRSAFPNFPVLEVPYKEIVEAPDNWLPAIVNFLSLDPARIPDMRAKIKPELYRNKVIS